MVVNLGLVYKVQHHSGVIFQFVAFIRKRKRTVPDVVAAGGRYDHLVCFRVNNPHSIHKKTVEKWPGVITKLSSCYINIYIILYEVVLVKQPTLCLH